MRFREKKIPLEDVIEKYLFSDKNKKNGYVTIRELGELLQK